jgi:hypothetical protein
MDIYIRNQRYYYSFLYLKALSGFSSHKLQYLLDKENISRVRYNEFWIYKLEDLYHSKIFKDLIQPNVVVIDNYWKEVQ